MALTAATAAFLFDDAEMESYLADQLARVVGIDADRTAAVIAEEIGRRSIGSSLGLVGFATLVVGSSLVFLAFDDAIDTIWHVPVKTGFRASIRRRLASYALALIAGALLIASFVLSTVAGANEAAVPGRFPVVGGIADLAGRLITGLLLTAAVAGLFRHVGPRLLAWRVALGAAVPTTVLMIVGTWLTGWYLQRWGAPTVSGAFGAVLVSLTWVYYEAQVVLAGAQLAKCLSRSRWSRTARNHTGESGGDR